MTDATIARLTEKLREDLAFAAPEAWALHIERRLEEAFEAGAADLEAPIPGDVFAWWREKRYSVTDLQRAFAQGAATTPVSDDTEGAG